MKTILNITQLIVSLIILIQCSASQTNQKSEAGPNKIEEIETITMAQKAIPPGHCRIIGTVVQINDSLSNNDDHDPCSKAPCHTRIMINQVLGYGAGFNGDVSEQQTIPVRFAFTTAETQSLGLELKNHMPGLQEGDRFWADIEYRQVFGGEGEYVVYFYEVLNNKE